jgi:anaphase-promoting complex subunit 5
MGRFLTPSKIALLALIEIYTDSIVPTTSTIPILSFILNQILPSTLKAQTKESFSNDLPFVLDLKSFETLLLAHPAASGVPGRSLWDHFLKKIWDIDSLDALHAFFTRRTYLLSRSKEEMKKDAEMGIPPPSEDMILLSRTSPFGSFVRRSNVEFERLRFNDTLVLWTSLRKWRQESKAYWTRRNGQMGRWAGDKALGDGEEDWGIDATEMLELVAYGGLILEDTEEGIVSTDEVEKLLEFQVEQMQSKFLKRLRYGVANETELGNRISPEVKDKFKSVLDESIMIPSLSHYLK